MMIEKLRPKHKSEQREGLAGEDRHGGVEPGVGHGMDPVELEQLDGMDQEQAHEREAAKAVDQLETRRIARDRRFLCHPHPFALSVTGGTLRQPPQSPVLVNPVARG